MVAVSRDAEYLPFEVSEGSLQERRTVRCSGPAHPDELVDAAHRKDSSQLDLFDGQHVKAHRVSSPDARP